MLPKDDEVVEVNDIHDVLWIVLLEELEDLELHTCLVVVLLLVLDDLDGHLTVLLMVPALEGRAK